METDVHFLSQIRGWSVPNFLSPEECRELIERHKDGLDFFCHRGAHRRHYRTSFEDPELASRLEDRLLQIPVVIESLEIEGFVRKGIRPPNFRLACYSEGHSFGVHVDLSKRSSGHGTRSFFTLMIYLNSNFEGGSTVFLESEHDLAVVKYRHRPHTGELLIFPQDAFDLPHYGDVVTSGEKFILRTDLFFVRSFRRATSP